MTQELLWKYPNSLPEGLHVDINLSALKVYASNLRQGIKCTVELKSTDGDRHWILLLSFDDGRHYIARIAKRRSKPAADTCQEVATMEVIRQRARINIPRVLGYEAEENNIVGAPFIMMELLPGNAAMDECGGYHQHHGQIPEHLKIPFYKQVALLHTEISSIRFPKIGTVMKRENGDYSIGPLPSLGGPFTSAREYFEAWAAKARFPSPESLKKLPDSVREEISKSIESFPMNVWKWSASYGNFHHGPFPLVHADFHHSNILVNKQYNITGIIDMEGACTLPWEMVTFPTFLETTPQKMDAPWNYDSFGQPKDKEMQALWKERDSYTKFVIRSEETLRQDAALSGTLRDGYLQGVAFALSGFENGKQAFYNQVLT